jgi:metallo-beta-lactamase class B
MKFIIAFLSTILFLPLSLWAQDNYSIKVTPLTSGVWVHTSYKKLSGKPFPSNGLIVEADSSVFLVDTAWDSLQMEQLIYWTDSALHKPICGVVATHWHDDRTGGAKVLQAHNIPLYVSEITRQLAKQHGDTLAAITFKKDTVFQLGSDKLEVVYPGPGHTVDNLVVWLPRQQVLYGGCLVKSEQATGMGYTEDADLQQWPRTIQFLSRHYGHARWIVPGHQRWNLPGHPANKLFEHTLYLLRQHHQKN